VYVKIPYKGSRDSVKKPDPRESLESKEPSIGKVPTGTLKKNPDILFDYI
jgi:hypothetical protein